MVNAEWVNIQAAKMKYSNKMNKYIAHVTVSRTVIFTIVVGALVAALIYFSGDSEQSESGEK